MSDHPPNQFARFIAIVGVIAMFVLVIVVIAISAGSSGGDSSGSGDSNTTTATSTDPGIRKAINKGEYKVQKGDTLTSISEDTGIAVDTLIQLNPDTDPQALIAGAKIKLR